MVDPEYIRSLIRANPFARFTVVTDDGRRVEVRRLGSVGMDPEGRKLFFADLEDGHRGLPVSCVKEVIVEPLPSPEMTRNVETIRTLRNASPFVPFTVVIDDGRRFMVDRSYRIGISPSGREICYGVSPVDFQRIPSRQVKEVVRVAG